jgi:hypothetical protein
LILVHVRAAIAGALLVSIVSVASAGQDSDQTAVLTRAKLYVAQFEKDLSAVVAEQADRQRIVRADGTIKQERTIVSDILLVRVGNSPRIFRDVISVDGKPVTDRDERVRKLFLATSMRESEIDRIRKIAKEGSRFDITSKGGFDMLLLPIRILGPLADRFMFETADKDLRFTEVKSPAIYRSRSLSGTVRDMFLRGTFTLDVQGRLLGSSVSATSADVEFTLDTRYTEDEATKLLLPVETRQLLHQPRRPKTDRMETVRTYSNFRRFQVTTDEQIALPQH